MTVPPVPPVPHSPHEGDWRTPVVLALAVFALRLGYLAWLSPYDLVDDEAHYWEWSRRPALSYYTKGPGVAWTIWLGVRLCGDDELGVRVGAAVAGLVAMLALAVLAARSSGGSWRVGTLAAASFALCSVFQATSFLMTIDGPYVACWIVAALAARELAASRRAGLGGAGPAVVLGAALGVGFLYKYTILLLVPGLVWHLAREREAVGPRRARILAVVVGVGAFALAISPVLAWNHARGWPTVTHLLGRLHVEGGDTTAKAWHYDPRWTLEYLAIQVGVVGPAVFAGVVVAARCAWRSRAIDRSRWLEHRLMLALAFPIFAFYLAVSFRAGVEGNWAIAGFTTLLVPLAQWLSAGTAGARRAWRWVVAYGLVSAVVLHAMPALPYFVPGAGRWTPLYRLTGQRELAAAVQAEVDALERARGRVPAVIAHYYTRASALAFYLRGRPRVWCASSALRSRRTAYDDFPDTRLDDPALRGRACVLVGSTEAEWRAVFAPGALALVRTIEHQGRDLRIFTAELAPDFAGPRRP